jgi:hypothetical protein
LPQLRRRYSSRRRSISPRETVGPLIAHAAN